MLSDSRLSQRSLGLKSIKRHIFVEISRVALIATFLYSGTAKILEYQSFRNNLSHSPVFRAGEVTAISCVIIACEFLVGGLLCFQRSLKAGFLLSFFQLTFYALYLIVGSFLFEDLPCPCGGIFSRLGFSAHVLLDLLLAGISAVGFSKLRPYPTGEKGVLPSL